MSTFVIRGGNKLQGTVTASHAKNSALSAMYAALLTDEESVLADVPHIEEIERTREILNSIGAKTEWIENHVLKIIPAKKLNLAKINYHSAIKTRAVLLMIGALAANYRRFDVPRSGGCKLGRRTVNPHIFALESFGIKIKTTKKFYQVTTPATLKGADLVMYEAGDTTTENAIMAAVLATGKTVIRKASANYMVQDLCHLLNSMGADIKGIGTVTLEITGVSKLRGAKNYSIMPDPIVAMLLISIAATTNSAITIKGCPRDFLELELEVLKRMNWRYAILRSYKSKNKYFDLIDIRTFPSKLIAPADKIACRPYPGLNSDNLPYFVPIATQAKGQTLIHDWVYENRAVYYMDMARLGADMRLADPHRVFISGPTKLHSADIICPPALRPASLLVVGMLAAHGKSVIRETYALERGFDNLYEELKKLGADIQKV